VGVEAPRGEDFPVMAIWGEKDSMIPVQHAYAAKEIRPDVRLEVLPDVGHFPHAERPALVAELIDDFISAGRSAGPGRSGACQIG
jgi:pimeloyl-ACP methyl ester carboxylesterase